MSEQDRKDFEAKCLVLAVEHYGYKPGDALLKSVLERRSNGTYSVEWVGGAWIGWQSARESEAPAKLTSPVAITFEGEALDALNHYRQAAYSSRLATSDHEAELEEKRRRAASDLAGWVAAMVSVVGGK